MMDPVQSEIPFQSSTKQDEIMRVDSNFLWNNDDSDSESMDHEQQKKKARLGRERISNCGCKGR
jgi:hypothetical protein